MTLPKATYAIGKNVNNRIGRHIQEKVSNGMKMTVEQGIQEAVEATLDGVADNERTLVKQHIEELEAKHQFELQYRLTLSRIVNAELKLLEKSQWRAEKWKTRAEELEERNDTIPIAALKTVLEYSEFRGWANDEAVVAYRKLGDWLQFRK